VQHLGGGGVEIGGVACQQLRRGIRMAALGAGAAPREYEPRCWFAEGSRFGSLKL
jgi:hypothetical protein